MDEELGDEAEDESKLDELGVEDERLVGNGVRLDEASLRERGLSAAGERNVVFGLRRAEEELTEKEEPLF